MIKNILYSLFLHSLLALLIYANFRSSINDDLIDLTQGAKVSMIDIKDLQAKENKNGNIEKVEEKKEEKPPEIIPEVQEEKRPEEKPEIKEEKKEEKKPEEKPVEKKKEVKKEIKKIAKKEKEKTRNKAALKPIENAKKEFKKIEEEKKEITKNIKEEKITEQAQDEEKEKEKKEEIKKESDENKEEVKEYSEPVPQEILPPSLETINLSAREKFNIHAQLSACYLRAKDPKNNSKLNLIIKVFVLQDGTIDYDLEKIVDINRYNNAKEVEYRTLIDTAKKALALCSPLRNLPLDKYDVWKEFTIKFGDGNDEEPQDTVR